jgi:hypothetical protein
MLTLCERAFYAFWGKNTEKGRENLRVLDMDWVTRTNNGVEGIERNKSDPKHVHCLHVNLDIVQSPCPRRVQLWALGWLLSESLVGKK